MGETVMDKDLTLEEQMNFISESNKQLQLENEKLRHEKELLKKKLEIADELVNSLEHLNTFSKSASEIAHEINNPVNFISGSLAIIKRGINDFIDLMNMYKKLDGFEGQPLYKKLQELEKDIDIELTKKELTDSTKAIEKGMERIHEISHNISLLGKAEAEKPVKINVNQSVADTVLMMGEKVSKEIEIRTNLGDIPEIMSYRGRLNQVFTNIIKNAVEAVQRKSSQGKERIEIKTELKEGKVVVSIKDSGLGMTDQTKERLFEKFYTTKGSGSGNGLGMGVCKAIVEKHKGSIDVKSEKGVGTEVTINLPLTH